jgi:type IV pilus assembly protein PilP
MPAGWSRRVVLILGFLSMAGLMAGCSKKPGAGAAKPPESAAQPPAQKLQAPAQPVVDNVESSSQPAPFEYNAMGKRDPFWSFYKEESRPGSAKTELPSSPLQVFEIDQLKLVAVIFGIAQPKAMVEAPDGKGYIVQLGTLVGKNFGRVTRISHNEVLVSEEFRDGKGARGVNTIHLALEKEKENEQ